MLDDFEKMLKAENSAELEALLPALNHPRVTSVRFNPAKLSGVPESVAGASLDGEVPWEPSGRYLSERPVFTLDPLLHQGVYYVQDASSMIAGEITRRIADMLPGRPLNALDCCAAPGGKTTAIAAALPQGSALIANEYDFGRAEILKENVYKWGDPSIAVSRGDTARFAPVRNLFDVIFADVPCSGEGMFRKDEEARKQWSLSLVESCAALQRQIVSNIIGSLRPGGFLVYSTCTFNTVENERNVEFFCRELNLETVPMEWNPGWNICGAVNSGIHASRFLPSRVRGEGLFVAVLRKKGIDDGHPAGEGKKPAKSGVPGSEWVDGLETRRVKDTVWGAPPALWRLIDLLEKKKVSFLSYGCEIAGIKGKDVVPTHALALSATFNPAAFPTVEASLDEALAYLRRQNISLGSEAPKGYVAITYRDRPLGMVKNMGNRCNVLMPKEWRIRI